MGDETILNTDKARKTDRDIVDLCPISCVIFVMNKSSSQKTTGAPAPGKELTAVEKHCVVVASQALEATQKDNVGT